MATQKPEKSNGKIIDALANNSNFRTFEDESLKAFKPAKFAESDIYKILQIAYTGNIPLLLDGPPQSGKTAAIKSFCRRIGAYCYLIIPSQRDPVEIGGIPYIKEIIYNDQRIRCSAMAPPEKFVELSILASEGKRVVIFIDELRNMSPAMQASSLGILLGGHVGDFELDPNIRVFAASNSVEDSPYGRPLAPPTASRLCHIYIKDEYQDFMKNFLTRWGSFSYMPGRYIPTKEKLVHEEPIEAVDNIPIRFHEEASAVVLGFLEKHRDKYSSSPKEDMPWPGRRTWDFASRAIAAMLCYVDDNKDPFSILRKDFAMRVVVGLVGKEVEGLWHTYVKNLNTPDPEKILANVNTLDTIKDDDGLVTLAVMRLKGYLEGRFMEFRTELGKSMSKSAHDQYTKVYEKSWDVVFWLNKHNKLECTVNLAAFLSAEFQRGYKLGILLPTPEELNVLLKHMKKAGIFGWEIDNE
jgi:hypothetical protein